MKLRNAALYFDNDSVYDGYTGDYLFKAQFSSFEGADPDGSFQRRRTFSASPSITLPARRVVKVQGERWVIGDMLKDSFKDRAIRKNGSAKVVTDEFALLTPGQAALQATGTPVYAFTKFLKDTVNLPTDADYDPYYNITLGGNESVADGYLLRDSEKLLRVRSIVREIEGFWLVGCDEIALGTAANVGVSIATTYDPITDTYSGAMTTTGILVDLYKMYEFRTAADEKNQSGDMNLIVAATSVTPAAGCEINIDGVMWRAISVIGKIDSWSVHVRRM